MAQCLFNMSMKTSLKMHLVILMDFGKSILLDNSKLHLPPFSPNLKCHLEMPCFLNERGEGKRMWHFGGSTAFVSRGL